MSESNVQLARRVYEAALRGELDVIGGLLDPSVSWHGGDLTAPEACHTCEQVLEFMRQARAGGRIGELIDVVDAGDKVVVIMRLVVSGSLPRPQRKVVEMVHYPDPDDALDAGRQRRHVRRLVRRCGRAHREPNARGLTTRCCFPSRCPNRDIEDVTTPSRPCGERYGHPQCLCHAPSRFNVRRVELP